MVKFGAHQGGRAYGRMVSKGSAALEVLAEWVDYAFVLLVVDIDEESGFWSISVGDAYCSYIAVWDG